MNLLKERNEALIYRGITDTEVYMTVDDLVSLACKGFITCEKDSLATGDCCLSRKYSGDDACLCIRSIFPNPQYYELYKKLREYYLNNLGKRFLLKIAGEIIREKEGC